MGGKGNEATKAVRIAVVADSVMTAKVFLTVASQLPWETNDEIVNNIDDTTGW